MIYTLPIATVVLIALYYEIKKGFKEE